MLTAAETDRPIRCDDCGKQVLHDGTGCVCVVISAACCCGEHAPIEMITDGDDALVQWVAAHTLHGPVEIRTGMPC